MSGELDGELSTLEGEAMQIHLGGCEECRSFRASAAKLHRSTRITAADEVPDLTAAILATASMRLGRDRRREFNFRTYATLLRLTLALVALVQIGLAFPAVLQQATGGIELHGATHLGGWDLAFAIGLLVVAVQPWRSRGLLPMAIALVTVMLLTNAIDLSGRQSIGHPESSHLLELAGLTLLWLLSRTVPGSAPLDHGRDHGRRTDRHAGMRSRSGERRIVPSGPRGRATASAADRPPARAA